MKFFDQIRRPKFGRGGGGSAVVGTMSQLWDFFFFDGFPKLLRLVESGLTVSAVG